MVGFGLPTRGPISIANCLFLEWVGYLQGTNQNLMSGRTALLARDKPKPRVG